MTASKSAPLRQCHIRWTSELSLGSRRAAETAAWSNNAAAIKAAVFLYAALFTIQGLQRKRGPPQSAVSPSVAGQVPYTWSAINDNVREKDTRHV